MIYQISYKIEEMRTMIKNIRVLYVLIKKMKITMIDNKLDNKWPIVT